MDIKALPPIDLIRLQTQLMDELAARAIVHNPTQPVGDYATYLACKAFDLKREPPSTSGYDACDDEGLRYQIKFKRLMTTTDTRQLNAVKGLEQKKFDFLIGRIWSLITVREDGRLQEEQRQRGTLRSRRQITLRWRPEQRLKLEEHSRIPLAARRQHGQERHSM
jgi:hypothetical protein